MQTKLRRWIPVGSETPALVGVVTRKKDFRLLADRRWYRIPVRTAPESLEQARYLAFYQTMVFGEEKWAVNWYARVRGLSRMRRIDLLPDEPRHRRAEEMYFRVDIDDLLRLPNPVPSRRLRRIVFIPTSLERLFVAEEINDLFKVSPIEDKLFFQLRKAGLAAERQFFVRDGRSAYALDMALFCRDGAVDIECDGERCHSGREKAEQDRGRDNALTTAGWRILRFSGREILVNPQGCVKLIRRMVDRLGGADEQGSGGSG